MPPLHSNLSQGRWFTLSLAQQLGNIGSEYERALKWRQKNNKEQFQNAFDRLLELLDLTLQDARWRNHRLKELTRLREIICEEFVGNQSPSNLQKYFMQFAILARS